MKQPELGRKIAELRLAKGLTQNELAEKCKISLRTIQRIETAEVNPRSYTARLIFNSLEFPVYDLLKNNEIPDNSVFHLKIRPGQWYIYFLDLFNLKTHTMRKITILSVLVFSIVYGISVFTSVSFAQSDSKVKKQISETNENFVKWFNSGDIESLVKLYNNDACLVSRGCGKSFIKEYYTIQSELYKFLEIKATDVSVEDSIAVEKGIWKAQMKSGEIFGGEYLSEWRLTGNKWLIVSESSGISID